MRVQNILRNACPICGKEITLAAIEPHPTHSERELHTYRCVDCGPVKTACHSTTFGWIDESGIASKFCRQRRAKPSRSPYRLARADFEEAVKLQLGRIITIRQKTLR